MYEVIGPPGIAGRVQARVAEFVVVVILTPRGAVGGALLARIEIVVVPVRTALVPLAALIVTVAVSPPMTSTTVKFGKEFVIVPPALTDELHDKATPSDDVV